MQLVQLNKDLTLMLFDSPSPHAQLFRLFSYCPYMHFTMPLLGWRGTQSDG